VNGHVQKHENVIASGGAARRNETINCRFKIIWFRITGH
jgi:hypothetical protein